MLDGCWLLDAADAGCWMLDAVTSLHASDLNRGHERIGMARIQYPVSSIRAGIQYPVTSIEPERADGRIARPVRAVKPPSRRRHAYGTGMMGVPARLELLDERRPGTAILRIILGLRLHSRATWNLS
jgi:hypothetical protein